MVISILFCAIAGADTTAALPASAATPPLSRSRRFIIVYLRINVFMILFSYKKRARHVFEINYLPLLSNGTPTFWRFCLKFSSF
jgi:hypothetical protein